MLTQLKWNEILTFVNPKVKQYPKFLSSVGFQLAEEMLPNYSTDNIGKRINARFDRMLADYHDKTQNLHLVRE